MALHTRMWPGPAGPSAVLLHGIVSSRYLIPTARRLAGYCTVLAPDLPGFGRTPASGPPLSVAEAADCVARWMAAAGVVADTVLGHSVGAQIATELAVRHPETLRRVVLVAPTVDSDARSVGAQLARWFANAPGEPASFNALATFEAGEIGPARMVRSFRLAVDHAIEDALPDVACPVLLVRGQHDRVVPQRWVEVLQRCRPGSQLAVVPGAAHTIVYTHPAPLAQLVVDFAHPGNVSAPVQSG